MRATINQHSAIANRRSGTSFCNILITRKLCLILFSLLLALLSISAISVDRLKTDVTWLADPAREGRHAGTPGAAAAADYISRQLKDMGCEVQMQDFGGRRKNVIGRIGTGERYILIGAHYDGQGAGMPSASDNAAGVATVLEMVRELKSKDLPVSLVAVAFDDEEQGLNGSRYYVDHPPYPLDKAQAAIIFDTLGRQFMDLSSWTMFVLGAENSKELAAAVQKRSGPEMIVAGTDLIGPRSDFAAFGLKHVPYLFFSHATHKDYHGPGDTADRVNYTKLAQDVQSIAQIVEDIGRLPARPKFLDTPVYPAGETAALQHELDLVEKDMDLAGQVMARPEYNNAPRVFVIVDNGSDHRGQAAVTRLARAHPNAIMIHTPVHASWLNQIEIFFSVIQKKVVTPNDFGSLEQLSRTLLCFVARYNRTARPFSWKFTASDLHDLMDRISRHEQQDDPRDKPLLEAA